MITKLQLSHNDAIMAIEYFKTTLEKQKRSAAIALVDSHGELIAFLRMDSCGLPFINVAINKAYTASRERSESSSVGKFVKEIGIPLNALGDTRYVGWGGGTPIFIDGELIGAVGISGLTEDEDMVISRLVAKRIEEFVKKNML